MMESLLLAWLSAVGVVLLLSVSRSVSPWGAAVMSPILGTALFTLTGLLLASVKAYSVTRNVLLVGLVAVVTVAATFRKVDARPRWFATAFGASLALVATVAVLALSFPAARVSTDSYHYLISAAALVRTGALEGVSDFYVVTRLLATPLIHTVSVTGRGYAAVWTPLLAISMFLTLGWLAVTGLRMIGVARKWQWLILVATFAFTLTTNRILFQISYINGHMLFAGLLLIGVGMGWLAVCQKQWNLLLPVSLVFAALVTVRAESVIVVVLFLVPFLAFGAIPFMWRWVILLPTVAATLVWDAWMLPNEVSVPSLDLLKGPLANVGLVIGMTVLVGLSGIRVLERYVRWVPWIMVPAVGVILVGLAWLEPVILVDSLVAMASGIVLEWYWGTFWILVPPLFVGALVVGFRDDRYFGFGLAGFILALPSFAYLRDIAFVATRGDSANRMLMHVAPLFLLMIVLAAGSATASMASSDGGSSRLSTPTGGSLGGDVDPVVSKARRGVERQRG